MEFQAHTIQSIAENTTEDLRTHLNRDRTDQYLLDITASVFDTMVRLWKFASINGLAVPRSYLIEFTQRTIKESWAESGTANSLSKATTSPYIVNELSKAYVNYLKLLPTVQNYFDMNCTMLNSVINLWFIATKSGLRLPATDVLVGMAETIFEAVMKGDGGPPSN